MESAPPQSSVERTQSNPESLQELVSPILQKTVQATPTPHTPQALSRRTGRCDGMSGGNPFLSIHDKSTRINGLRGHGNPPISLSMLPLRVKT